MTLLTSLRVRLRAREAETNVARRRRERLAAATWSPDAERRFKEACDLEDAARERERIARAAFLRAYTAS